jgi:hypothetical protein
LPIFESILCGRFYLTKLKEILKWVYEFEKPLRKLEGHGKTSILEILSSAKEKT